MPHEKGEVEVVYFTGSDFGGNNLGFNMDPGRVRPEVVHEMARRATSNAPSNLTEDSLKWSSGESLCYCTSLTDMFNRLLTLSEELAFNVVMHSFWP